MKNTPELEILSIFLLTDPDTLIEHNRQNELKKGGFFSQGKSII